MSETWRRTELPQIVADLARRPGHEAVRVGVSALLHNGFGEDWAALSHEVRMPEVHGRADMLVGGVVFEFKQNLDAEWDDVVRRLPDYLAERTRQTGRAFIGIATDGTRFVACERSEAGLRRISEHAARPDQPEALLGWLEAALSAHRDLVPEPLAVQRMLGRDSISHGRARSVLQRLWQSLHTHPEVAVKRQLWDQLLRQVYGSAVGDDSLFLQHTYLTIIAKTIAARVLDLPAENAADILSGRALDEVGIHGAVEGDFFDWVLLAEEGKTLVHHLARQVGRFRLRDVQADVLKGLYESLIDPAQRHDLGEYYTPDWMAAKLTRAAIARPLQDVVLDPACGSGTFLFHALRHLMAAAQSERWAPTRILRAAAAQVRGLDIHPVAVIIARVTWLLALGDLVRRRDAPLHVPVFLGDALQWNLQDTVGSQEIRVSVPDAQPLRVPVGFAEDQAKFEPGLQALTDGIADAADPAAVNRTLRRIPGVTEADAAAMTETFTRLRRLVAEGRDGIWPFILRNLVRPLWLSRPDQRADVLIGNPPWVAYRFLSADLKQRLREACEAMNLWVGGVLATQQDLSALFWARSVERYLKPGGTIAFVLPYAALNRPAFQGLRFGDYRNASVRIVQAWSFDEDVKPLFPVPACVLIARRETSGPLPAQVTRYAGILPRRDAHEAEADRALTVRPAPWPPIPTLAGASPYRARFKQGATIVPRRFFLVERDDTGRLGSSTAAPRVRGKVGKLDKEPWKQVEPPRGPVEAQFLRPLLLGETVAPFRIFDPALAVIPEQGRHLLDAAAAAAEGHRHLAAWLRDIERKWAAHCRKDADGTPVMTLLQRIDHMRGLSAQSGTGGQLVVYSASGTLLAAAHVRESGAVVEHQAYWTRTRSVSEAGYLTAILNSETVRARIAEMQPRGQGGARHFDNLMWELPIPEYDRQKPLHRELAAAAQRAERIAAGVALPEGAYFTAKRRAIREALAEHGIAARIEALVARLLGAT